MCGYRGSIHLLVLISLLTLLVATDASAQEFWMHPDKFVYKPGDTAKINFVVGNNFSGENWNVRAERVDRAALYTISKKVDLKNQLKEGTEDHLRLPLKEPGTYLVIMESNKAFVELPAERFNDYLKEYALDVAANERKRTNTLDKPGKEFYTRNTKLVIQVGDKPDDGYKKIAGMPLEIVPEKNPATYQKGDVVYFKILFEGKPLFGARAFVWNNKDNRIYTQPIYSQQDGRIEVRVFNDGEWMVSVVWMVPSKDPKADWQSYWGSLIFRVE